MPVELYYAAELDGAGPVRRFFRLTLPLMRPTFYFAIIFATIVNLQLFDSVFVADRRRPRELDRDHHLVHLSKPVHFGETGFGSTLSFVLVAVVLLLTAAQTLLLRGRG